jgi:UDP-N-acetylmuramyl-tripeptide synthetase
MYILKNLLIDIIDITEINTQADCLITGITADSRKVKAGDLFLAYRGEISDGHEFISDAINNGAVAILCENKNKLLAKITVIVIPDLKEKIGLLAARFYGNPAKDLTIIGVTGTNGKTTITQFIASSLTDLGISCGVIGTIGVGFPGKLLPTINTTPDPITLQYWLAKFKKEGAQAVAMEVSSHSLIQQRVNGIAFKIAVFTNLTREHLNYHKTMKEYGKAKEILFMRPELQYAVINIDDKFGHDLIKKLKKIRKNLKIYSYTAKNINLETPAIKAENIKFAITGIAANIVTPWGSGLLKSSLLGGFNLSNLMAVIGVLGVMKIKFPEILAKMARLKTVNGRMQTFGGGEKPLVVVDYAHTPDALEQVLLVLRECCLGSLWCVFGCGGNKDTGKRPIMGQIAERYSDYVVITNDNPRTEDPEVIINDILQGVTNHLKIKIMQDRRAAILAAIDCAKASDIILIAGKGHEDYQVIGTEKIMFSDQEIVINALNLKK